MAFAPTPGGTRGWEEGRRLCGAKPGQGPRPHAALHGARFADGILWVCTELLWFPPSPRTGGSPRAQVRATRSPRSPSCPLSQLGPAPGRTQTPSTTSPPPCPSAPRPPNTFLGALLPRGASGTRKRCLCGGSQLLCPGSASPSPALQTCARGAKSPASGTFLLSWDQLHLHQQEPSRGFQGAWGQPPEPAGTAGTLWARHKQCRIHSVTPGHAQRTGCLAKGAAAAGVGAGRSCSAPRCPHFPAPQCPDRCLARQGTPARWGRGPVVVGRVPCSPWVPSSVEVSAKQAQRWLGSVRFSCRGLINS